MGESILSTTGLSDSSKRFVNGRNTADRATHYRRCMHQEVFAR
jgi:hypothetical protein